MPQASNQSRRGMRQYMAHYIRENLKDGDDLVEFYLDTFKGQVDGKSSKKLKDNIPLRMAAGEWLSDRGWGRPQQHIELDVGSDIVDGDLRALPTKLLERVLAEMDKQDDDQKALPAPIEAEYVVTPLPTESYSA